LASVSIEELLQLMVDKGGSDLHISAGSPPRIRVDGILIPTEHETLGPNDTKSIAYSILSGDQVARFEGDWELDMSFGIQNLGRFRTNVFLQRGAVGCVLRVIPTEIKGIDQLGLPRNTCVDLLSKPKGLVLVTGATGSGKSTTLAAMIDYINENRREHVVTIEDPIEFVHKNKGCLFNQREVGSDTKGFGKALRSVLRQDPDVVLIGEMRDLETIEAALTLAETGHLTFGTLHTSDCVQTINRVVDVFPAHQQQQIRTQLSFTLQAVFCQQLLPASKGKGRALCAEIMTANSAIRALIRDNKVHQIYSQIQIGGKLGMQTMNAALCKLVVSKKISKSMAVERTTDLEELTRLFAAEGVQ